MPAGDVVEVTLPGARWEELTSRNAAFALMGRRHGQTVWTVPLDVQHTPLSEIAAGRHDTHWAELGRQVAAGGRSAVVRLVIPAGADPQVAATAFRQASSSVRRSEGVLVEWSPQPGTTAADVAAAWPGDDAVDLIGVDPGGEGTWAAEVAAPGGLAEWKSWAVSKRKRLAVHWTLDAGSDPRRVRQMAGWLDVAARGSSLAYDTVDADETTDSRTLTAYRRLWARR